MQSLFCGHFCLGSDNMTGVRQRSVGRWTGRVTETGVLGVEGRECEGGEGGIVMKRQGEEGRGEKLCKDGGFGGRKKGIS